MSDDDVKAIKEMNLTNMLGNRVDEDIDKGKFTAWCKNNGFKDGPSKSCAKKAMASGSTSAHKMATFYLNTVKP